MYYIDPFETIIGNRVLVKVLYEESIANAQANNLVGQVREACKINEHSKNRRSRIVNNYYQTINARKYTKPNVDVALIFDVFNYKHYPFCKKIVVLTSMQKI